MRICGLAAEGLRNERFLHEAFPSKELQDYWSTRPHYELNATSNHAQASGSQSGDIASTEEITEAQKQYQAWLKTQRDEKDELPPPAYSLEAIPQPAASSTQVQPTTSISRYTSASVRPPAPPHSHPAHNTHSQPSAQPPPVNASSRPSSHRPRPAATPRPPRLPHQGAPPQASQTSGGYTPPYRVPGGTLGFSQAGGQSPSGAPLVSTPSSPCEYRP